MQASLMSTALEAYVIDDDMLAAVQRTVRGIEVTDETLAFDMIRDVVHGDGHFLGHPETLARMRQRLRLSGGRRPQQPGRLGGGRGAWTSASGRGIGCARSWARTTPSTSAGTWTTGSASAFDIRLPREAMRPGNGRW